VDVAGGVRLVKAETPPKIRAGGVSAFSGGGRDATLVIGRAGRRLEPLRRPQRLDVAQAGRDQQPVDATRHARRARVDGQAVRQQEYFEHAETLEETGLRE
jgi:hypothetical protein